MHIPEKRVCDCCQAELTGPYMAMSYPLDQAVPEMLRHLADEIDQKGLTV